MKKFGIIVFIVAIAVGVAFSNLFSFGKISGKLFTFSIGSSINGSGTTASETRKLDSFTGVDVGGIFQVDVVAGKDFEVQVEADDNLLEHIKTEVSDGVLKISSTDRLKSSNGLRVRVSAPDNNNIEVSGVCKLSVSGLKNSDLRVGTSGASKVKLEGETEKLAIDVSGASKVDAENLKAVNAKVETSGASHVNVFVTGRLVTDSSGASKIGYSGDPLSVEKNTSGVAKVYKN